MACYLPLSSVITNAYRSTSVLPATCIRMSEDWIYRIQISRVDTQWAKYSSDRRQLDKAGVRQRTFAYWVFYYLQAYVSLAPHQAQSHIMQSDFLQHAGIEIMRLTCITSVIYRNVCFSNIISQTASNSFSTKENVDYFPLSVTCSSYSRWTDHDYLAPSPVTKSQRIQLRET